MVRFPLKRFAARLLLAAAGAVLGLGIAEVAVRSVRPQSVLKVTRGLYAPDPPRRYRLQPGFRGTMTNRVEYRTPVTVNRLGLRGEEIADKPPGSVRVLALGNSFTFGVGARDDETYPVHLEGILRSRGRRAQVLNAGAPGFGVPDAVAWLERWGWSLQPDLVVLGVFLGNDLQDAASDGSLAMVVDGELRRRGEGTSGLARWLNYNSHLFLLLKTSPLGNVMRELRGRPEPMRRRTLRAEFELYEKDGTSQVVRQGLAATEEAVDELVATATDRSVVAVLIPSLPQVDPTAWSEALERLDLDPERYDATRPNRMFRELFERRGIPVFDASDALASAVERGEAIYYPIDQHLTPAGYRLLAEQVAGVVQRGKPESWESH